MREQHSAVPWSAEPMWRIGREEPPISWATGRFYYFLFTILPGHAWRKGATHTPSLTNKGPTSVYSLRRCASCKQQALQSSPGTSTRRRQRSFVEARKFQHQYPHALKVKYYIGDPSTDPPKTMYYIEFNARPCFINPFST